MTLQKITTASLNRLLSNPTLDQVTGKWGTKVYSASTIKCNFQPAGEEELQKLSEGNRTKNVKLICTDTPLQVGDRIIKNGETFEILHLEDFSLQPVQIFALYQGIGIEVKE